MYYRHQGVISFQPMLAMDLAFIVVYDMTHGSVSCGLSRLLNLQVRSDVEKLEEIKKLPKSPVWDLVEVGERQLRAIWLWCRWEADEYFQQPESKLFLGVPNSATRQNVCKPQHGKFRLDTKKDFHWNNETLGNGVYTSCEISVIRGLKNSAQQRWYGWEMSLRIAGGLDCVSLEVPSNVSVFLWIQICFFFIQKNILNLFFPVLTHLETPLSYRVQIEANNLCNATNGIEMSSHSPLQYCTIPTDIAHTG